MKKEDCCLQITPGLLKSVGILVSRYLLYYNCFGSYLYLMNINMLLEDPTQYLQWTLLVQFLVKIPFGFFFERLYTLPPRWVISGISTLVAGSTLIYGVVLVTYDLSLSTQMLVTFLCYLVTNILEQFETSYYRTHLVPEMHRRYGVSLGVLNSADKLCEATIASAQLLFVGYLYVKWDFQLSSFYICTTFTIGNLIYAALAYAIIGRIFEPAPARKGNSKLSRALQGQFGALWNCPIRKLILADVLRFFTIQTGYIKSFELSAGLDADTSAQVGAFTKVSLTLSTILNILKYRLPDWMVTARWSILSADFISLINSMIFTGAYMYERAVPWFRGEDPVEHESMPTWMIVQIVYALATTWLHQVCHLMYQEYFQVKVAPSDRGPVQGVTVVLSIGFSFLLTVFNLFLSTELLYITNFSISVVVHVAMLVLVASYILDTYKTKRVIPEFSPLINQQE